MDNNITALKAKALEMTGLHEQQSRVMGEVLRMVNNLQEQPEPIGIWTKVQEFKDTQDCHVFPYSPAQRNDQGNYDIYFLRKSTQRNYAGRSVATARETSAPRATIIKHDGRYYATDHEWLGNPKKCYGRWWMFNENTWKWMMIHKETEPTGEDRGLIHRGGEWILYQRKNPAYMREIEYRTSAEFPVLTEGYSVRFNDLQSYERAYSAIPFDLRGKLYTCVNVLNLNTWSVKPRIYEMLVLSRGERPRWLILPETETNKQVFAIPKVIDDKVVITTIQCHSPHGTDDGTVQPVSPHYTQIYTADVLDVERWLQS